MTELHEGGCRCGAVRFRAEGRPKWIAFCHCASCRKATASPVAAYAGYRDDRVRFSAGTPAFYASSEGVKRGFCRDCGTPLTYEGLRWPDEIHLHVGAFDDPAAFPPENEAYKRERLPWLRLQPPQAKKTPTKTR